MSEYLLSAETIQTERAARRLSRRKLLALAGVAAVGAAAQRLEMGIILDPPPLIVEDMLINKSAEGIQLFSMNTIEEDGSESILSLLSPIGKLLYEPSGEFFDGQPFNYVHRGGNGTASIDEALNKVNKEGKEGPLILDIDANVVDGVVYGEHGIIYRTGQYLPPLIVDVNEKEVRLGGLDTYEELVAYIAELSRTSGRTLAASTELKRGEFDLGVLHEMFAVHQKYKVPGQMHSPLPHQFDAISYEIASD